RRRPRPLAGRLSKDKATSLSSRDSSPPLSLTDPLLGPGLHLDGRTAESEPLADLVDQVPLVGKVQLPGAVGEEYERRRPHRRLRHIENLPFFKVQRFDEAVQLPRRNPRRSGV